jgi:predicted dehydrogenase
MGRYLDTFRKARELLQHGVLGPVRMVRSSMYIEQLMKRGEGWRYDPRVSGGGVLITQNSHLVDKLCWMFGDVRSVSGHTTRFVSAEVEDHVHAYFEFVSGAVGYLDASWSARHYRTPTISIHAQGDNGTLDVDDDEVRVCLDSPAGGLVSGWHRWRKPDLYQGVPLDIGGPQYSLQMMGFLQAVRSGSGVESDIASGIRTQRVIDAIYASARSGGAPQLLEATSR